jgi:signal transduction histidine kinase
MLKDIILLLIPIFLIHIITMYQFMPPEYSRGAFWIMDIYLFFLVIFSFRIVTNRYKKERDRFVKIFMTHSVVKVFGVLIFLSTWLVLDVGLSRPMLLHFLILLVPVLFIDTYSLIKMVKLRFDEKE